MRVEADLRRALTAHPRLNLVEDSGLGVMPIRRGGGSLHRSFRVAQGGRTFHVKLAGDERKRRGLRRWWRWGDRIAERFAGPTVVDWLELPDHGLAGPVLAWIEGVTPASLAGPLRVAAIDTVAALHADREFAACLAEEDGAVGSCRDAYHGSFHRRFLADLDSVRAERPPFVTEGALAWMEREALAITRRVDASAAFDDAADRATHGDLWLDNLLVEPSGALRVLDWAGLRLGDPMMDWALLFGPAPSSFEAADAFDLPTGGFSDGALGRLDVLARASLLDWVIDSLADWVEATPSPSIIAAREAKHAAHEKAVAAYRYRYRSGPP